MKHSYCLRRHVRSLSVSVPHLSRRLFSLSILLSALLLPWRGYAQPEADGVAFLLGSQQPDGSWRSSHVRAAHVTTESMRALQELSAGSAARASAAALLESDPIADTDDRARRVAALAADARDVTAAVAELVSDAAVDGGWGLTPDLTADPLDTSLALAALAPQPGIPDALTVQGLASLLDAPTAGGAWPCVVGGESDVFCTGYAVLALVSYRSRFFLEPQITAAGAFLRGQINPDGSVGMAGNDTLFNTALAALALRALGDIGSERLAIIGYLEALQLPDGSWNGDAYDTALALRALHALLTVPVCGDGVRNQASESCDRSDLAGATCESLGLGPGLLGCSDQCTFDTRGCAALPRCGDGVRNQSVEACDGPDLGGVTCQALGFLGGTLQCGPDCTFDASGCTGVPFCGDGVVNRIEEQCDRTDLADASCTSLGLLSGTLQCNADCTYNTTGCTGTGQTDPRSITITPASPVCTGGAQTIPVSITFPAAAVVDKVDVFFLFDDTGSFAGRVPTVVSIFNALVSELQTALPGISLGFGVGRYEDYGGPGTGFSGEFSTGRPFILNQPVISTDVADFSTLISAALNRTAPGFGGDGPETTLEALYQIASGAGFDGNGNGTTLDSGPAGAAATQTAPGSSGDVPAFASNVAATSGTLGGAGFRPRALHLVIQAGDICSVSAYTAGQPIPPTITGPGGATVPSSALRCSNSVGVSRFGFVSNGISTATNDVAGAVAPRGAATTPDTIAALNMLGVQVIGLADGGTPIRNPVGPSSAPSVTMSALALLTGATDETGNPLVFNIAGGTGPLKTAIVQAVVRAATRPVDVTLRVAGVPAGLGVSFTPPVVSGVAPGEFAAFDVTFVGDGTVITGDFAIDFVDSASNTTLGTLPVSVGCLPRVDVPPDADGDGYRADVDCDDANPAVNPGAPEVPGNGIDDDCNPATPDVVPAAAVVCTLVADRISYPANSTAQLEGAVINLGADSLVGLNATATVTDPGGRPAFAESRSLNPVPPGGRTPELLAFQSNASPPGEYQATLAISAGNTTLAVCSASFIIESTAATGAGLGGTLIVDPSVVNAGDQSTAFYTLRNQGNSALVDLPIRVLVVDPDSGQIMGVLDDMASITPGGSYSNSQILATIGLQQKTYLVILRVAVGGEEQTLASATLTVVNEPPDCSHATANPAVLWPPNHQLVDVSIDGVTDPDQDPVSVTVVGIFQDEPPNALGDGNTCPDGTGTGTATASLRAERTGTGDGRVYQVRFIARDGRGGTCNGEVAVCVPHDQGEGAGCVDGGALSDSTVCPLRSDGGHPALGRALRRRLSARHKSGSTTTACSDRYRQGRCP